MTPNVAMPGFMSVLHPPGDDATPEPAREVPACFPDLNLDRIVAAITAGREEYDLAPFFYAPLPDLDAIAYRQEIMQDLEAVTIQALGTFAETMRAMRQYRTLAAEHDDELAKQRWHLASAEAYAEAVEQLAQALGNAEPRSRGLEAFRVHLMQYAASGPFRALAVEARTTAAGLAALRFGVVIRAGNVTVRPYAGEADYSAVLEETFDRFRRGAAKDYRRQYHEGGGVDHVQAQILRRVALLYPEPFQDLARFCERHAEFADATMVRFDREIQFYLAILAHVRRLEAAGLRFCYPVLAADDKSETVTDAFDLALADKLVREGTPVVCNDYSLHGPERVLVVTGPNQGGKTTFARMVGQLHYLARLGGPIPGREARLLLCDRVLTHFERAEDLATMHGKLEDDLVRMHALLQAATPASVLILNEVFSSTTAGDSLFLSRKVLERVMALDCLCVCVTFLDELAALGAQTVSMVGTVDAAEPSRRTFRIARHPANGLAYALAIAEKHRVTRRWLLERLAP